MSILKGLLTARGGYFKTEQEDDLAAYRRRRLREGALKDHAGALLEGEVGPAPHVSDTKLAEIHAQEARLSASGPGVRRSVSWMPPMSADGGYRPTGASRAPIISSARNAMWSGCTPRTSEAGALAKETAAMRKSKAVADKALAAGRARHLRLAHRRRGRHGRRPRRSDPSTYSKPRRPAPRLASRPVRGRRKAFGALQGVARRRGRGWRVARGVERGEGGIRWVEDSAIVRDLRRKFRMRRREPVRADAQPPPAEERWW